MAKAQLPPEVGDTVQVLKDDDNHGELGEITELLQDGTLIVRFGHSGNTYEYSPDEVVLFPANHILG